MRWRIDDLLDKVFSFLDRCLDRIEDFLDWVEPYPEHPYSHHVCKGCDHLRYQHATRWLFRQFMGCRMCNPKTKCRKFIPQAKHFKNQVVNKTL